MKVSDRLVILHEVEDLVITDIGVLDSWRRDDCNALFPQIRFVNSWITGIERSKGPLRSYSMQPISPVPITCIRPRLGNARDATHIPNLHSDRG